MISAWAPLRNEEGGQVFLAWEIRPALPVTELEKNLNTIIWVPIMKTSIIIGLIILIIVIGLVFLYYNNIKSAISSISSSSYSSYPVALTDPIQAPNGTSAVVLYYSSLEVITTNGKVYASNIAGSVNLMGILNLTQVLGSVNLPKNVTVKVVILNLTKATITINGTTYPVEIPPSITFPVNNQLSTNSSIVLDVLPSIAPIYGSNQTIYVLVPSGVGVVYKGAVHNGETVPITVRREIDDMKANISIINATITYSGGATHIKIYVRNNGNTSTVLMHVLIFGKFDMVIGKTIIPMNGLNINEEEQQLNNSFTEIEHEIENEEGDPFGNNTFPPIMNISLNSTLQQIFGTNRFRIPNKTIAIVKGRFEEAKERVLKLMKEMYKYRVINFFVLPNGSLSLPEEGYFNLEDIVNGTIQNTTCKFQPAPSNLEEEGMAYIPTCVPAFGYVLSPGQTVELVFNANITEGGGIVTLIPTNGSYRIMVQGTRDAHASYFIGSPSTVTSPIPMPQNVPLVYNESLSELLSQYPSINYTLAIENQTSSLPLVGFSYHVVNTFTKGSSKVYNLSLRIINLTTEVSIPLTLYLYSNGSISGISGYPENATGLGELLLAMDGYIGMQLLKGAELQNISNVTSSYMQHSTYQEQIGNVNMIVTKYTLTQPINTSKGTLDKFIVVVGHPVSNPQAELLLYFNIEATSPTGSTVTITLNVKSLIYS